MPARGWEKAKSFFLPFAGNLAPAITLKVVPDSVFLRKRKKKKSRRRRGKKRGEKERTKNWAKRAKRTKKVSFRKEITNRNRKRKRKKKVVLIVSRHRWVSRVSFHKGIEERRELNYFIWIEASSKARLI